MSLLCQRYVVPCKAPSGETIRLSIARYSLHRVPPSRGTILFCSHGHGGYKEQWVPLLEHLLNSDNVNVTEAWCIDWYLYGDSLAYNRAFVMATPDTVNLQLCGQVLVDIISTDLIPWKNRDLVFVGHSAGVYPIVHLVTECIRQKQPIPFSKVVLCSPALGPAEFIKNVLGRLRKPTAARDWQWPSRDEAEEAVQKMIPWKTWNGDVKKTFIEYGMVHRFRGSELKVPAFIEAIGYPKPEVALTSSENGPALLLSEAYARLPEVCRRLPVHFIYGGRHDFVPQKLYTNVIKHCAPHLQTVHEIPGGHLIIHENPLECAEAIKIALLHKSIFAKM